MSDPTPTTGPTMPVAMQAPPPPTPGYKTSEFWLTMLAMLVGMALTAGFFPDTSPIMRGLSALGTLLASLGYTYGRSTVKAAFHSAGVLILVITCVSSTSACAASKDEVLSKIMAGVTAAQTAFLAFDKEHQDQIVTDATSLEQGKAALAAYRDKRKVVATAFVAAYGALAAASLDPSTASGLAQAASTAQALLAALRDLGVIR